MQFIMYICLWFPTLPVPCKHAPAGPMLDFCGHSGLGPAQTKPKQAQCGFAQARPTDLGSPQALCEQPTLWDCPRYSNDGPVRSGQSNFCTFGPMQVWCRQPCNATRRIQTTLTGQTLGETPPTEPGFSQGFGSFGSLPLSPLACSVGDT